MVNVHVADLEGQVALARRVKHLQAENNRLTTNYLRLLFAVQDCLINAKPEKDLEKLKEYLEFLDEQVKQIEEVRKNGAKKKHVSSVAPRK